MHRFRFIPSAALIALALAGCGKSSPTSSALTAVTTTAATTAATTSIEATGRDLQSADSTRLGGCGALALPAGIPGGCPYDAASQWFTCGADLGPGGFPHTRRYPFL